MRSIFISLIDNFFRILCRIQAVAMATRLNAIQYVSIIVGAIVIILESATAFIDSALDANGLVVLLGFVALLTPALSELIEMHRNNISYTINSSKIYHDDVLQRLEMTPDYQSADYQKRFYNDCGTIEGYVDSSTVNRYLFIGSVNPAKAIRFQCKRTSFRVPDEVRPLVLGIIQRMLRKSRHRRLFNGSLVRLCTDIFPDKTMEVTVQKTRYFDGQCTHELAFKQASHAEDHAKNFKGETLLMDDENNQITELWESHCANFIGASTIAITSDGYLLIGIQGGQSMANANRLAPSGSGSVEYSDLKRIRSHQSRQSSYEESQQNPSKRSTSLQTLISYAAERELREECAVPEGAVMRTYVIGYARLLERGGKPDFFCVTFMEASARDILDNFERRQRLSEVALGAKPITVAVSSNDSETPVSDALDMYLEQVRKEQPEQHRVSIQLQLSADYIRNIESTSEWDSVRRDR